MEKRMNTELENKRAAGSMRSVARIVNSTRTLEDTPSVRGMITKVRHLVRVVGE